MKTYILIGFSLAIFSTQFDFAVAGDVQRTSPLATDALTSGPSGDFEVPVEIKGQVANFRLHTASDTTVIADSVATQLQLPRDHVPYRELVMFAGTRITEYAEPDYLRFNGYDAPGTKLFVVQDRTIPFGIAGMLGFNYLKQFDVELNFVGGKVSLYSPGGCSRTVNGSAGIPIDTNWRGLVTVNVQLDGNSATALIDTGQSYSILSLDAAKDMFGFDEKTPGLKAVATHGNLAYLLSYPFKTLAFDRISLASPDILIQTNYRRRPELMLGASVLRRLQLCIAYDSERLYTIQ